MPFLSLERPSCPYKLCSKDEAVIRRPGTADEAAQALGTGNFERSEQNFLS